MKKTISMLLAMMMLMALCVPSFAKVYTPGDAYNGGTVPTDKQYVDEKKQNTSDAAAPTTQGATVLVQTDLTQLPSENGYFTVTIPADAKLIWGQEEALNLDYTVESHLVRDKRLSVEVTSLNGNQMKTADKTYALAYQLNAGGATDYLATTPVVYPAVTCPLKLTVASDAWLKAVVEAYSDTLTFTVKVA